MASSNFGAFPQINLSFVSIWCVIWKWEFITNGFLSTQPSTNGIRRVASMFNKFQASQWTEAIIKDTDCLLNSISNIITAHLSTAVALNIVTGPISNYSLHLFCRNSMFDFNHVFGISHSNWHQRLTRAHYSNASMAISDKHHFRQTLSSSQKTIISNGMYCVADVDCLSLVSSLKLLFGLARIHNHFVQRIFLNSIQNAGPTEHSSAWKFIWNDQKCTCKIRIFFSLCRPSKFIICVTFYKL